MSETELYTVYTQKEHMLVTQVWLTPEQRSEVQTSIYLLHLIIVKSQQTELDLYPKEW